MNLYMVVEGDRTEPYVYPRWMARLLPALRRVDGLHEVQEDHYLLVRGHGHPAYEEVITAAVADLRDHPDRFDALMICVDAERIPAAERRAQIAELVEEAGGLPPRAELVIVVADPCIETWFLGNRRVFSRQPNTPAFQRWRAFYNVHDDDPALMPAHSPAHTPAQTHHDYLRDMLGERNMTYSKNSPASVAAPSYLDALCERVRDTPHLASLRALLDVWARWSM